jgi:hypothetical protein
VTVTLAADARRALLGGLIDHAALFPPASMSIPDAVAEDRRARESSYAWMVARFVCPASKLAALGEQMPWDEAPGLSIVLDGPIEDGSAPIEAVEVKLAEPRPQSGELIRIAQSVRQLAGEVYFELMPGERWRDSVPAAVGAVAAVGGRVKLRCGGEAVPPDDLVALVLVACRDAGVVMKATAGLHHPMRRGRDHGFLNLLVAATLAHARRAGSKELEGVLAEEDLDALPLADLTAEEIASARAGLFTGFGSCSWREPVEDLRELGVL